MGGICIPGRQRAASRRSSVAVKRLRGIFTLALVVAGVAWGQVSTGAIPRTADGHPDFSGIWQVMNTAEWDIQAHQARPDAPAGLGVVEGDEVPYQPWAAAKKKENFEKRATADPLAKCYLPGVPRITYTPLPFQIFQGPKE